MTVSALGVVLFAVSIFSLYVYTVTLARLLARPRRPGLVRTAACRVGVALAYVGVAVVTLLGSPSLPTVALCVFIGAQVVWQTNAVLDLRLTRGDR